MEEERGPGSHDHSGYLDRSPPDDPHLCVCTGCVTCLWTSPFSFSTPTTLAFLLSSPWLFLPQGLGTKSQTAWSTTPLPCRL